MKILTRTLAYGCTGGDPETDVLAVGETVNMKDFYPTEGDYEVEEDDNTARWVDPDEDTVTVLKVHEWP